MPKAIIAFLACAALAAASGCGAEAGAPPAELPASGRDYLALPDSDRAAVAASCRDRGASAVAGRASRQLRAIEPAALRAELDSAYRVTAEQRRPVAEVCLEALPYVTPGLRVEFEDTRGGGDAFTVETRSDRPLTMRGRVSPAPRDGRVVARRETGSQRPFAVPIGRDGRFTFPGVRLARQADNTFILTVQAPPNAARKVRFSAICLDCLAVPAPPPAREGLRTSPPAA